MSDLDALLEQAQRADPGDRITLRDPISALGEEAIEPMTVWLDDPRLSGFAVRVLERIGREADHRSAVIEVLTSVDRTDLPPHLISDLDWALGGLGVTKTSSGHGGPRKGDGSGTRPTGTPGRLGVGYWAMRTSPWERPYIWSEAQSGRLRQGWGWAAEQDLEVIEAAVREGEPLSEEQQLAWRSRRMLSSQPDGMRIGDLIVSPNLCEWGRLGVFRLVGEYEYAPAAARRFDDRFGHILPVELLAGPIDRSDPLVSDALRWTLRNLGRLWSITAYGGDVERLVRGPGAATRRWSESEYEQLFRLFPLNGAHPTADQVERLAAEFHRTVDAITWQWEDGAAYISGRAASTTSLGLKQWLDRHVHRE